jgi:ZIP family zinc transporter
LSGTWQIAVYGTISGLALLAGAWVGTAFNLKQKTIAEFMAFGSGVLVCALTFGLMEEAFGHGGFDAVVLGFTGGGVTFIIGDYLVHRIGGKRHKKQPLAPGPEEAGGEVIALGALLDGIPESLALGIALFNGQGRGLLMLIAIVLSNFPEGISSISGLRREGFSKAQIYLLWAAVGLAVSLAAVLSYVFLTDIHPKAIGTIEAFAAGAILAMLADSMMPEAFEEGGFTVGLFTVLGFLVAFLVSRWGG